jgi:uncharacterized membrane protein
MPRAARTQPRAVVESAIDIARSAEDVFDYCTDLTREPEWNPKARRVEKVTDGPIGLGTRYEAEFLKGSPMTIELVRFERTVAWASAGRSRRLDAKGEGRVSATEDGARLVMRMELRPKGTLRLLLPILGRFTHKQEERNLTAIKQALEGSGSGVARRGA